MDSISRSSFISSFAISGSLHMIRTVAPGRVAAIRSRFGGICHSAHHLAGPFSTVLAWFQPGPWVPSLAVTVLS